MRRLNTENTPSVNIAMQHGPSPVHPDPFDTRVGANLYFYEEIDTESILHLNRELRARELDCLGVAAEWGLRHPPSIKLHINSPGGDVFAGLAAVSVIKNVRVPVETIVEGLAGSAATLMSVVATKRKMYQHSYMLIHQVSTWMEGTYENAKDEMNNLDLIMETVKGIYTQYTSIPSDVLDGLLKRDLLLDAKTALEYKLVDEVI